MQELEFMPTSVVVFINLNTACLSFHNDLILKYTKSPLRGVGQTAAYIASVFTIELDWTLANINKVTSGSPCLFSGYMFVHDC